MELRGTETPVYAEIGAEPISTCAPWKERVSWQVVPKDLPDMLEDQESARAQRAMDATLHMKKQDIRALERAFAV